MVVTARNRHHSMDTSCVSFSKMDWKRVVSKSKELACLATECISRRKLEWKLFKEFLRSFPISDAILRPFILMSHKISFASMSWPSGSRDSTHCRIATLSKLFFVLQEPIITHHPSSLAQESMMVARAPFGNWGFFWWRYFPQSWRSINPSMLWKWHLEFPIIFRQVYMC